MSLENIKEGRVHVFIVHIDFYFYLDKAQSTCQKIIKGCCQDICISFFANVCDNNMPFTTKSNKRYSWNVCD